MGKKTKKEAKKSGKKEAHAVPVRKKLKIDPGKPAKVLSSKVAYDGKLFRVIAEEIREADGRDAFREVVRHGGSTVILAVDGRKKKDPLVLIERQYRHAAQQYLYEIPAGKLEANEDRLAGAKRELQEETGYTAKKWSKLAKYYPSPGFLGEWMQVFLAEDLTPGETSPDEDEWLELQLVPLSEVLRLIDAGKIRDGKTIIAALSYARRLGKRK
jgi:ADP-ribose pyrophosphatase